MSFRPKLVTLFHDPHSPVSKRVLGMLQARAQPVFSKSRVAPAQQYLDDAVSQQEPLFELEVVDRSRATHDQWRVIASYMKRARPSQVEALKDEVGPFVVAWDEGTVARTEAEAEQLAERVLKNKKNNKCTIV